MAVRSGKYAQEVLQAVQTNSVPSMVAVLFENQMAMARSMGCVVKVPVALAGQPECTRWASVCASMAPVDEEARQASADATKTGFAYYDGYDLYDTEQDARDTRFVGPMITRPNPVFDANYTAEAFENREVYRANTIVSVAATNAGEYAPQSPSSAATAGAGTGTPSFKRGSRAVSRTPSPAASPSPPTPGSLST